ncbi:MAG: helix-turn-helix domain-containing protein [Rivularia sp. (in: cyanobacteria)]
MAKLDKEKLKEQVIRMLASGLNQSEAAKKLGINRQNISYWMKSQEFRDKIENLRKEKKKSEPIQILSPTEVFTVSPALSKPDPQPQPQPQTLSRQYYFQKELAFLDEIERKMMPYVCEGSVRAAGLMLKLSERRSKLLALDVERIHEVEAVTRLIESNILPIEIQKAMLENFQQCQNNIKNLFNTAYCHKSSL